MRIILFCAILLLNEKILKMQVKMMTVRYKYRQSPIMAIALLLCGNALEAGPLHWYYYSSKAWAKAAAAIAFTTYAVKTSSDKPEQKKKEPDVPYTINVMWINKTLKQEEPHLIQPKDKLAKETYSAVL